MTNGVAVVVGGSRGIGGSIAADLMQSSDQVVTLDILPDGPTHAHYVVDVSDPDAVTSVFRAVEQTHGAPAVLVNAAGILLSQALVKTTDEEWGKLLAVNLSGCFHTVRAALPGMLRAKYGRIINIASITPLRGEARSAAYAATKGGIVGMSKALSREVAHHGITVNCVAPGYVMTEMTREVFRGPVGDSVLAQIPTRRFAVPADIVHAVRFLASSDASYVTGQTLVVDGGVC